MIYQAYALIDQSATFNPAQGERCTLKLEASSIREAHDIAIAGLKDQFPEATIAVTVWSVPEETAQPPAAE